MNKKNLQSLLIPGDFPPIVSGIATYFYEIWKYFDPDTTLILAPVSPGCEKWDHEHSLNIIRKKIPLGDSFKDKIIKGTLYSFWAVILYFRFRYKKLHCGQVLSSGVAGWIVNLLFGTPYYVYVYGSETFRFGRIPGLLSVIKLFLMKARRIIPNSAFTRDEFLSLRIPEDRFDIITPGVDVERFSPAEKAPELVDKYSLKGKFVLLTVARLDERKGHDVVIRALSILKDKYPFMLYLIVGKGREEGKLKLLSKEKRVEDQVYFCGYVSDEDLPKFYNLCELFILLNRQTSEDPRLSGDYEGFGIVFLEASACAKPVIAGDYGGIRDAVEDGKSGFIINGKNPKTAADYIERLYLDKKLREKMGKYGRERAVSQFSWKLVSEKVRKYL